jgi:hypothetical protein
MWSELGRVALHYSILSLALLGIGFVVGSVGGAYLEDQVYARNNR